MKKHGKKYTQAKEKISETKQSKSEAIKTCQEVASAKFDESVEIGDLNNPSDGWVTYDPTQGASSDELTEICNTLYDRCLLAELGIKGFTPAGEQHLIKS